MYFADSDYRRALEKADELAGLLAEEPAQLSWFRAQVYYALGNFERSIEYLDRYLERLDSSNVIAPKQALVFRVALAQQLGDESAVRHAQARLNAVYPSHQ